MDKNGFYKDVYCKKCGVKLQGFGEDRPAESYAGTYNGLCYKCTGETKLIAVSTLDNAMLMSYPPAQPSWRRDREVIVTYANCMDCKGQGFSWRYKNGGRLRDHCERCQKRYYNNPARVQYRTKTTEFHNEMIRRGDEIAWLLGREIGLNLEWLRPKGQRRKGLKTIEWSNNAWETLETEYPEFYAELGQVVKRGRLLETAFREIQPNFWDLKVNPETLTFSEKYWIQ